MTNQEINEAVARKLGVEICTDDSCPGPIAGMYSCESALQDYSTSIEAAWELTEKIPHCTLYRGGDWWRCSWLSEKPFEPTPFETADTAPMAICLAFLKLKES